MLIVMNLALVGCVSESEVSAENTLLGRWTATWEVDSQMVAGTFNFTNQGRGILEVEGKSNSLLVQEDISVDFTWQKTEGELIIQRLDNGIQLNYSITDLGPDRILMSYTDDVIFTLTKQEN